MSTEHEMQIEGHKLVAQAFNPTASGQPVILMHGITGSIRYWGADQLDLWLAQGPCYALSLPGHYPAVWSPGSRSDALTAEMIARVLSAAIRQLLGQQAVTLAGHSTGGFAALAIAAHNPDLAGRVVSISGFAQGQWTGALGFYQRLVRQGSIGRLIFKAIYNLFAGSTRWRFRAAWSAYLADKRAFYTYPHIKAVFQATLPDFKQLDLDAMIKYFGVMPDIDISNLLPRITAPTLALSGDRDPIVPPAQARLIAERVPGADLHIIQGGGHILFAERPAAYRRALSDWLHKTSV